MTNILKAISNLVKLENIRIEEVTGGNNRMLSMGEGLESFVKDLFANTFGIKDKNEKLKIYHRLFSYQGSRRTPPDLMIRGGDAIEVKKVESLKTELQLNSSHPKSKLLASSRLINSHCRTCEVWTEKDIIYTIGHVQQRPRRLSSLWFVYGSIYAADEEVYTSLKRQLTQNIERIPDIEFSPTNEVGRINQVDPLNITNLRIRGMWLLKNPYRVFDYVHQYSSEADFQCITIIPLSKYNSFSDADIDEIESLEQVSITDVNVKNPNNPVDLIACKLIRYQR